MIPPGAHLSLTFSRRASCRKRDRSAEPVGEDVKKDFSVGKAPEEIDLAASSRAIDKNHDRSTSLRLKARGE
jgi:hypothetical protein